jgi:hypothetical protein
MTAELVAFPGRADEDREALVAALLELHALLRLDHPSGATPTRAYLVANPQAMARIAAALPANERRRPRAAYALIAYDFPFAFFQFGQTTAQTPPERIKALITGSAGSQDEQVERAARAVGFRAQIIDSFDAPALKQTFFPQTQESVVAVLALTMAPE